MLHVFIQEDERLGKGAMGKVYAAPDVNEDVPAPGHPGCIIDCYSQLLGCTFFAQSSDLHVIALLLTSTP
jgi:hypothetical protein